MTGGCGLGAPEGEGRQAKRDGCLCGGVCAGPHYAVTLKEWCKRFTEQQDKVLELGYSREFFRKFVWYFSICEVCPLPGSRSRPLTSCRALLLRGCCGCCPQPLRHPTCFPCQVPDVPPSCSVVLVLPLKQPQMRHRAVLVLLRSASTADSVEGSLLKPRLSWCSALQTAPSPAYPVPISKPTPMGAGCFWPAQRGRQQHSGSVGCVWRFMHASATSAFPVFSYCEWPTVLHPLVMCR